MSSTSFSLFLPAVYLTVREITALIAVVGITLAAHAQAGSAQDFDAIGVDQVIDGDELRRKGITRLGEVLRYVQAARTTTVDGFEHRFSLHGLGSFHEPGPAIYVDGHPVELGVLGTETLNLLGIPVEAIERLEIVSKPALISGTFAGRGAVHIHTKAEVEGLRAEAAVGIESEVGDPGPFAYLDEQPNVDTHGPDLRALVEAGGSTAGVRAAGLYQRHYLTKPPVLLRRIILQDFVEAPVIEIAAPAVTASWGTEQAGLNLIGLGAAGTVYPFFPHAAREVSATYRAANVSALLQQSVSRTVALRHRISAGLQRAEQPSDSSVPFEWEHESFSLNSALGRSLPHRVVVLGATGRLDRARTANASDRFTGSLYAAIAGQMSENVQYQGGGMLMSDWESSALKAYAGITLQPDGENRGDVYVTIAEELPHEQNVVDAWTRRDLEVPHVPSQVSRPPDAVAMRATGDAEWTWSPNRRHSLAGGVGLRISADTYTYRRTIQPMGAGYRAIALSYGYAEGTTGIFWMEYSTRLLPGRQRLFFHHQSTVEGDDLYYEVWRAVPDTRFGASIYAAIAPDFEVEAVLTRLSNATWSEFALLEGVSQDVEGATIFDLSVYKRLFAGRVHARMALRNMLRDELRFHPLGDAFDLAARFDLRVEFGTRR